MLNMNSLFQCLYFMLFSGVYQTIVSGGRGARSVLPELAMNPFITQSESRTFIKAHRGRRSVSCTNYLVGPDLELDCLHETICECNKPLCNAEMDREYYCHGTTCSSNQICYLSVPCIAHYETTCTDDNCLSYPCVHGTCNDGVGTYTCTCTPGYGGQNCENETNECDSNPCQNGGTCTDLVNEYTCSCPEDFTGTNCETDMCQPQFPSGADVIFLLDSSTSQSNSTFHRQIQYVKNFVEEFPITPTDFQIALVTASTEATVHFYLNNHTTASAMMNAIDDVTVEGGASFTGKGLQTIREVILDEENGARSLVPKYVLILTDGLFSDSQDATLQASMLDAMGVEIIVIGIGQQVLHMELMNIASHWTKIFPSTNNDAVNVILIRHVMQECPDCFHSTSDVLFMIDSSSDVDWLKYSEQLTALDVMLRSIPVGIDDVHVSFAKFADDVVDVCGFDEHFTTTNLRVELNGVSRMNAEGNITKALQYARREGFSVSSGARHDTRKFVILVTSRDFSENIAEIKVEAENLKESGVTLVTVAIDAETADHYLDIATDPVFVYILGDEINTPHNVLYTLVGSLDYDVCERN